MLVKALRPITKMVTGKGSTRTRKFRYQVRLRGRQVSKHYTKKAATAAARKLPGARISPIRAMRRR
jgi:hypothetical protein